jgi:hypothetical protein
VAVWQQTQSFAGQVKIRGQCFDISTRRRIVFSAGSEAKHFSTMGNFCSSFRAVFKPNEGTSLNPTSPTRGSTRKPDVLPKPPATVDGTTKRKFHVLPSDKLLFNC